MVSVDPTLWLDFVAVSCLLSHKCARTCTTLLQLNDFTRQLSCIDHLWIYIRLFWQPAAECLHVLPPLFWYGNATVVTEPREKQMQCALTVPIGALVLHPDRPSLKLRIAELLLEFLAHSMFDFKHLYQPSLQERQLWMDSLIRYHQALPCIHAGTNTRRKRVSLFLLGHGFFCTIPHDLLQQAIAKQNYGSDKLFWWHCCSIILKERG